MCGCLFFIERKIEEIRAMNFYITKIQENPCHNICIPILISNKNNIKSKVYSLSLALDIISIGDFVAIKQM